MSTKKENFNRISDNRVSKIIFMVNQLTNLTNTSFYEYDDKDIEEIFEQLDIELKRSKEILLKNNERKRRLKKKEL